MTRSIVYSVLLILGLVSLQSCFSEEVKLTRADYKTIDTIFINQDSILSLRADALCDSIWDERFEETVDSFFQIQIKDIEQYYNSDETAKTN